MAGYSCANVVPLGGGPKDITPPKVIKTEPDTFSLRFAARKIVISFDEFVVVKNAAKEVNVSPPVSQQPVVQVTGKSVEVIFQDSLASNTTYTIQFGNAIVDNNEGNVLPNYTYVFSTGDVLDSLDAAVTILDAYTLKPVPGVKWLLYDTMNDSTPYKEPPFYLGYTGNTGDASIQYMRGGEFGQFALLENNNNSIYDKTDEWIGFTDSIVVPGDSTEHRILLFKEKPTENKLKSTKLIKQGMLAFRFATDARNVTITPLTDSLPPLKGNLEYMNETFDSLIYWFPKISADTMFFAIDVPNKEPDTIRVVHKKRNQQSGRNRGGKGSTQTTDLKRLSRLTVTTNLAARFDYFKPIELEFSEPLTRFDTACINLLEGEKPIDYTWEFTDSVQRKIEITATFKQGARYEFRVKDSCLAGIWGNPNDSLVIPFKASFQREYAGISIIANGVLNNPQLIFQLLDDKDKVLQVQKVQQDSTGYTCRFTNIVTGNYRVKLIYDENGNGKWDTGNFQERKQPERVTYFPRIIDLKAGFDMQFDWDVNAPVKKENGNLNRGGR